MQARYLRVRGVPGALVAHPHADPAARRFLGKSPKGPTWLQGPTGEDGKPQWPASQPVEENVREDGEGYLRKAIRRGELVLVAECRADSMEQAEKMLAVTKKPAREK